MTVGGIMTVGGAILGAPWTTGLSAGGALLAPAPTLAPCGDVVVCVPARNEARRIPTLIAGLNRLSPRAPEPLRVVLLLNNCSDASRRAAECAATSAPGIDLRIIERRFPVRLAHAGSARRAAMEAGADWLEQDGVSDGVVLTTDADAAPDRDWVVASCAALEAGADVAAAAVAGDPAEEARFPAPLRAAIAQVARAQTLARDLEDALDPVPGDPAPRHMDHTGGGLALRLATYRAVGGCPPLPFREDLGLVDAVRRMGGVVRHCPAVRMTVSARMRGRAPGGMASTISAWSQRVARGAALLVPDPAEQMDHWSARASARTAAVRAAAALPEGIAARVAAAEVAWRCPDPVDWRSEVAASDAISLLEQLLDDQIRPRSAA